MSQCKDFSPLPIPKEILETRWSQADAINCASCYGWVLAEERCTNHNRYRKEATNIWDGIK